MKIAFASLLLLAGCQSGGEANNQAAAPAPAPKADPQVNTAEQRVRQRVGTRGPVRFVETRTSNSGGATIVCGAYEQRGARHRYIVVGGEEAFVEPDTPAGDMAQAFAEFCGDGELG